MPAIPIPVLTIGLLIASNVFVTFAWFGHLRFKVAPLVPVIGVSWFITLFEYILQVPANRIGHGHFSAAELKTIQEVITPVVLAVFPVTYLKESQSCIRSHVSAVMYPQSCIRSHGTEVMEPCRRLGPDHRRGVLHLSQMGMIRP